jgi:hypothetical protein
MLEIVHLNLLCSTIDYYKCPFEVINLVTKTEFHIEISFTFFTNIIDV